MAIEYRVPRINTNDNDVEILRWYVKNGQLVKKGEDLVDLGTSKANVNIVSEFEGYVACCASEGASVAVGELLVVYHSSLEELKRAEEERPTSVQPASLGTSSRISSSKSFEPERAGAAGNDLRLSQAAEQWIQIQGVDRETLRGLGLVTARHLRGEPRVSVTEKKAAIEPAIDSNLESKRLTKTKRIEIDVLTAGQSGNINSSVTVEFRVAEVKATLERLHPRKGQALLSPLILYELCQLLKKHRDFNAFYHEDRVYYYDSIDLGVAIDLGKGLKVPVIPEADRFTPLELHRSIMNLGMKYLEEKLTPEDLAAGTVTITDLSSENILHFQPLLNRRQSIILGLGGDAKAEGHPMALTMVFDHRVLSGREVAKFLNSLKAQVLSYSAAKFSQLEVKSETSGDKESSKIYET